MRRVTERMSSRTSNQAIELSDISEMSPGETPERRLFGGGKTKKKERVTIVDDGPFVDGHVPAVAVLGSAAAAAVFTMDGPSIRDVLSPNNNVDYEDTPTGSGYQTSIYAMSAPRNGRSGSHHHQDSFDDDGSENNHRTDESEEEPTARSKAKKVILSLLIVALIAITWTGSTQFAKTSLSDPKVFDAPYFLVWFNTNWMCVCFPFYIFVMTLVLACCKKKLTHAKSPYRIICDASQVFGPSGMTPKAMLTRSIPFTVLWIVANYSYSQALAHISAAETTTVFSSNLAFVYLLSWIFLHDAFVALRILAMLLAIVGIVLMVHADGLGSVTFVGVVCAVVSAAVSAIYKVLFKKIVGDANFGQVSLFMTMLGIFNLVLSWPIALILILTNAETISWNLVPWPYICGSAILSLLFNLFVNVGIAYTHPFYISLGLFLGLPLNGAIDAIWRREPLKDLQIVGGVCILVSFLFLMLPEDFASSVLRWCGISRHHRDVYIITTRPESSNQPKRGRSLAS